MFFKKNLVGTHRAHGPKLCTGLAPDTERTDLDSQHGSGKLPAYLQRMRVKLQLAIIQKRRGRKCPRVVKALPKRYNVRFFRQTLSGTALPRAGPFAVLLLSLHVVDQGANSGDRHLDHCAVLHRSDTERSTAGNHVAGHQRQIL